jgi:hypothetical protein
VVGSADGGEIESAFGAGKYAGQNFCRCGGEIGSAGRSARLVMDDSQFFSLGGYAQYC